MRLVDVVPAPGGDPDTVLRLAGALEDASEHPIAAAIAAGARERLGDLPVVGSFANSQGLGGSGTVEGHAVIAGGARGLTAQSAPPLPGEPAALVAAAAGRGRRAGA